ncbi:MAG: E2/UBC family protein [Bacteroidota bacterium]|nr:E2/UBC family protein [Bacteroidota bacterium]
MMGKDVMAAQLQELGFTPISYGEGKENFIGFQFKVPHGKFCGQQVEIALQAPQFPVAPPSGIFIKPRLLPARAGNQHPYDGITDQVQPTDEFQYWSRSFNSWGTMDEPKHMEVYLAFIRTLFDFD